jgi:EmrB/QacA subfamily drug resistance transporter
MPDRTGRGWVLALACVGQAMVVLDVSVVNVALPTIQQALGFDPVDLQWVANAYTLVFGGLLLVGGRLADVRGRRWIFLAGLGLFTAASLAGGLATDSAMLVAARAVQGLAAAALAPVTLTVLTTTYPEGAARTRALAIWTAVSIAGGAGGNLLGGVLTEFTSWRSILLINVPIGAAALAVAVRRLPDQRTHASLALLDLPGALAAVTGLVALTYGISRASTHGWTDPVTLAALCLAVLAIAVFALIETRHAGMPLLPPALLVHRGVSLGNVAMLLAGAGFQVPMWYFLTLYMQNVLGYSALQAGIGFLPHTLLTLAVGLRVTPWLMRRVNHRTLVAAGASLAAIGFWWQSLITVHSTYLTGVLGPAILIATGGGLFNTPLTSTAVSDVHNSDAGAASGLMNTAKQVGGALGLSALIALAADPLQHTASALVTGYRHAFLAMSILLALTAAITPLLPIRRDRTSGEVGPDRTGVGAGPTCWRRSRPRRGE